MVVFGESWNPSETVRLTARILAKQVGKCDNAQLHSFIKGQKDGCRARLSMWLRILGVKLQPHPGVMGGHSSVILAVSLGHLGHCLPQKRNIAVPVQFGASWGIYLHRKARS